MSVAFAVDVYWNEAKLVMIDALNSTPGTSEVRRRRHDSRPRIRYAALIMIGCANHSRQNTTVRVEAPTPRTISGPIDHAVTAPAASSTRRSGVASVTTAGRAGGGRRAARARRPRSTLSRHR